MQWFKKNFRELKSLASKAMEISFVVIVVLTVQKVLLLNSEGGGIHWENFLKDPILVLQLVAMLLQAYIMHEQKKLMKQQAQISTKLMSIPIQEKLLERWLNVFDDIIEILQESMKSEAGIICQKEMEKDAIHNSRVLNKFRIATNRLLPTVTETAGKNIRALLANESECSVGSRIAKVLIKDSYIDEIEKNRQKQKEPMYFDELFWKKHNEEVASILSESSKLVEDFVAKAISQKDNNEALNP